MALDRRPNLALDDGYFASRYIAATLSIELEAALVGQLNMASYKEERSALHTTHSSAWHAATADTSMQGEGGGGASASLRPSVAGTVFTSQSNWQGPGSLPGAGPGGMVGVWQPGLPPGILYGPVLGGGAGSAPRGPMQEVGEKPAVSRGRL